jgi:hypothetical protein
MSWRVLALSATCWLSACGSDGGFEEPTGVVIDDELLDTSVHLEPDLAWDNGLEVRDRRWNYILARNEDAFVLVIGTMRLNLINTNTLGELNFGMAIRLVGDDGYHDPDVPFRNFSIDAGDTVELRENFVVAMRDRGAANTASRMTIAVF